MADPSPKKSRFSKLNRRSMSPVEYMNSPAYKNKKKSQFGKFTYISPKAYIHKQFAKHSYNAEQTQLSSINRTSRALAKRVPLKRCQTATESTLSIQPEAQNPIENMLDDSFLRGIDQIEAHSLGEDSFTHEFDKKIKLQQQQIEEQSALISSQDRQLSDMKMREKKLREELQRANLALMMCRRKNQEDSKRINELEKRLSAPTDRSLSFHLSEESILE